MAPFVTVGYCTLDVELFASSHGLRDGADWAWGNDWMGLVPLLHFPGFELVF